MRALVDSGKLDEAERVARAGGDADERGLSAKCCVLRGRLGAGGFGRIAWRRRRGLPGARTRWRRRAEIACDRGDRGKRCSGARALAGTSYEQWRPVDGDDQVAAGRAYMVLGRWDPRRSTTALRAFDQATSRRTAANLEAQVRAADLLLDKYNAPDARELSTRQCCAPTRQHPRALLGLARVARVRWQAATPAARCGASLASESALTCPRCCCLPNQHLEAEQYDSAMADARRALAVDSARVRGMGDSRRDRVDAAATPRVHRALLGRAAANQPQPSDFYAEIGEAAGRQRRYGDAVRFAGSCASQPTPRRRARSGVLGENELRTGEMAAGRANLERAFAIDPYNLWHKNMLDLLDNLRTFSTVDARASSSSHRHG